MTMRLKLAAAIAIIFLTATPSLCEADKDKADVKTGEDLGGVCPPQIKMTLDAFPTY